MKLTWQIRNDITGDDYHLVTTPSSKMNVRKFVCENEWFADNIQETLREQSAKHGVYTIKLAYKPYGCEKKIIIAYGVYFGKDVFVDCESFDEAIKLSIDKGVVFAK